MPASAIRRSEVQKANEKIKIPFGKAALGQVGKNYTDAFGKVSVKNLDVAGKVS